jgi:predicted nucleotidyltransferase
MFDYPLTRNEIFLFLENRYEYAEFREALAFLAAHGLVFRWDDCYSLKNDYRFVVRRNKGNRKAEEMMRKARKVGKLLSRFPYVRGVGISGSLSKNFADEHSDIDLFIITSRNRLWIARTIMHCFKKLTFLVKRQHDYCMNYYVDEAQLEIVEKNIYTAIEVATMIPLQGSAAFSDFYAANAWIKRYLPNQFMRTLSARTLQKHSSKNMVEGLLNNALGNWLEGVLMKITAGRWNKKTLEKRLNLRGTVMSMAASEHFAKPDPRSFQLKLMERYERKLLFLLEQAELN